MAETDKNVIFLNDVGSTNNYANQLIVSKQAVEGTVVLACYQKEGKGQRGNTWESEAGKNVLMSIVLFPEFLAAENQFMISKVVSLALVEFLRKETAEVSIKWPNDLYVGSKKIAGILIENGVKGRNLFSSVLGIGLNLNQEKFISGAPNPVSLRQITGKDYEFEKVANEITDLVFEGYRKLKVGDNESINVQYFETLFRKDTWCKYRREGIEFVARIIGIGDYGQLRLEDKNGIVSEYMFKEVEFVI
jgi:BirA family transcriptional regulator, biotin operon repressor / biotin---[acetyl-CoA-carboxylase] ligase